VTSIVKLVKPLLLQEYLVHNNNWNNNHNGSNIDATIDEIMHLITGEFLGSRSF